MRALEKFPKGSRLLTRSDFDRVFKKSKRIQNKYFSILIHFDQQSNQPRLGLIVSKKVDKRAVQRNRFKRLIRESFRRKKNVQKADYVVLVKSAIKQINNKQIFEQLNQLWLLTEKKK